MPDRSERSLPFILSWWVYKYWEKEKVKRGQSEWVAQSKEGEHQKLALSSTIWSNSRKKKPSRTSTSNKNIHWTSIHCGSDYFERDEVQ